MLERQDRLKATGVSTKLIFPVKLYDFTPPAEICDINTLDVSPGLTPMITPRSSQSTKLWRALEPLAAAVAETLRQPPPFDPQWADLASDRFHHLFAQQHPLAQRSLPSLGGLR